MDIPDETHKVNDKAMESLKQELKDIEKRRLKQGLWPGLVHPLILSNIEQLLRRYRPRITLFVITEYYRVYVRCAGAS